MREEEGGMTTKTYMTRDEFYSSDEREFSPEWDYGVMWRDGDLDRAWPTWRVSWVVATGEVYACSHDRYWILGVVPAVGDYPTSSGVSEQGALDRWAEYNKAQDIERVMKGWADKSHRSLEWVEKRIRAWEDSHRDDAA
jgi:hypothetical protein